MATTAPRGDGEDLGSGGRMTADLQRVLEGKQNMADQVMTPASINKKMGN